MIFNLISGFLILLSFYNSYQEFRKDSSLIRKMYMTRITDYFWSLLLVIAIIVGVIFFYNLDLPRFMTWSWFSIFSGDSNDVGNVITQPFNSGSIPLILSFWVILCIALPYLAKIEEEIFRSNILTLKKRVLYSLYFGFAHMVMGVSITVSLVLSVVGFIYSIFYIREYNRIIKSDPDNANTVATLASSSIHTKYNFILVTLLAAFSVLLCIVN
jgi:hypothetical protein